MAVGLEIPVIGIPHLIFLLLHNRSMIYLYVYAASREELVWLHVFIDRKKVVGFRIPKS
jgi:hypothetical protein